MYQLFDDGERTFSFPFLISEHMCLPGFRYSSPTCVQQYTRVSL